MARTSVSIILSCNPEPNPLDNVSWLWVGPLSILSIQGRLSGCNIGVFWLDYWRPLENLPEAIEEEEDRDADVGGQEIRYIPVLMVLANKDVETVKEDNEGKEDEGCPSGVWLEMTLEYKSVAINALSIERLVKLDVSKADGAPGEEASNGGQVLKPTKCGRCATTSNGKIG